MKLTDTEARVIAQWWQREDRPRLAAFAATGAILTGLLPEIITAMDSARDTVDLVSLIALRDYALDAGVRPRVNSWTFITCHAPWLDDALAHACQVEAVR